MTTSRQYDFDVAISYAGEDSNAADGLANALLQSGIKVFYAPLEQANLLGENLYDYLTDLYHKRARYCVMFLSQHYAAKLWTNLERQAAQARAFQENKVYILPVRLDDTEIPGILPTTGYVRWPPMTGDTLANMIIAKLAKP
jgi:hypothetical protein